MKKHLFVLLACLFVVMIGFGITLPVLPFYVERLGLEAGVALLATAQTKFVVFAFVALLSLGMAFIAPNLSALISKRGGEQQAGASLGVQNAANSLGQAGGPLLGGVLFIRQINAPYLFSGAVLLALALIIGWKAMGGRREARLA